MKDIVWLANRIKSPPFGAEARFRAGRLLRRLQLGERLSLPESRPMPGIAAGCHELRIKDVNLDWRIVYFVDGLDLAILMVFQKTTRTTPGSAIQLCRMRLRAFLARR